MAEERTMSRVSDQGWLGAFDGWTLFKYALVVLGVLFFLTPLETVVLTAFKTNGSIIASTPVTPPGPAGFTVANFGHAWNALARGVVNSLLLTIPATILDVLLGSMAAYGLTLVNWRGQLGVLVLFIVGIFIPYQAVIVPLAKFWSNYLSLQSLLAPLWALSFLTPEYAQLAQLIVTDVAYGIPICMFLFRGYYKGMSTDVVEAAKIDGASLTKIYFRIVLPLSLPMVGVVFIYQFTQIWNEFLFALTIVGSSGSPVAPATLVLSGLGEGTSGMLFGLRMAGALITAVPTIALYLLFSDQFAAGLEGGGA